MLHRVSLTSLDPTALVTHFRHFIRWSIAHGLRWRFSKERPCLWGREYLFRLRGWRLTAPQCNSAAEGVRRRCPAFRGWMNPRPAAGRVGPPRPTPLHCQLGQLGDVYFPPPNPILPLFLLSDFTPDLKLKPVPTLWLQRGLSLLSPTSTVIFSVLQPMGVRNLMSRCGRQIMWLMVAVRFES